MKDKTMDYHHRLPESRGWRRHYDNMLHMNKHKHRALHVLYDNSTPLEIVDQTIEMLVQTTWKPELVQYVSERIKEVLEDQEYFYKPSIWILIPKRLW